MSPLQILGAVLLASAFAATVACFRRRYRRGQAAGRVRSEAAGLLGQLASDSARAEGEFEAALAGIRSAEGPSLAERLANLVGVGRQHGQRLEAVHSRLERLAAAERGLATTVGEVARQKERVDALCRTAEQAEKVDPVLAVAAVTAAVADVVENERGLRAELTDAKARLEGRAARLAGGERDLFTDQVTQMPNRRAFEKRLASDCAAESPTFAVLVLGVSGLSEINAGQGHAAGDAVLAVAGRVIRESVRPRDFAARIGAGEFGVLLPGADERVVAMVVESCRRAARGATVRIADGQVGFRFSTGFVEARTGCSGSDLLAEARAAIREAGGDSRRATVRVEEAVAAMKGG